MKVLIADSFEQSGLSALQALGVEVLYRPGLKEGALVDTLLESGAEVLVVRSTRVTEAMLSTGFLSLVVRAGAGVNTIDVEAASRQGVYVANCPGKNAVAVAELAFGLLLAIDRRIPENVQALREGRWEKKRFSDAPGLKGRTLGLLGLGAIGVEMVRRANAFGMPVLVWTRGLAGLDRPLNEDELERYGISPIEPGYPVAAAPTPAAVAAGCDVLSVHLPLCGQTRALVDASVLGRLKPGSVFLNTARGELVNNADLTDAIRSRGLRVGLDVFEQEPAGATGSFTDEIVQLEGVYGTHHIGASTRQAQEAIAAETVRIVRSYLETGRVPNVVNLCTRTPATHKLVVRHRDRPGVLAHIFEHIRAAAINAQETENVIFAGAHAAVATINLDGPPSQALLERIAQGSPDIFQVKVIPLSSGGA